MSDMPHDEERDTYLAAGLVIWVMGIVGDNAHDPEAQKFLRRFF
ncbi:hypothetical protein [Acidocella sp.]|jgi:hypothetical protein